MVKIKTDRLKLSELRIKQGMLGTDPTPALAKKLTEIFGVPFDNIFTLVEGD